MRELNAKEKDLCLQLLSAETPSNYFFEHLSWDLGDLSLRIEYDESGVDGRVKMMFTNLDFTNMLAKFDGGPMLEIIRQVVITVTLIKLLESEGLIMTYRSMRPGGAMTIGSHPVQNENLFFNFPDKKVAELILEFAAKQIIITDEFRTFCNNGYITRSEYRERRNERIANKAFWASIIAVLVSVIALLNDLGYIPRIIEKKNITSGGVTEQKESSQPDTIIFPTPPEFHTNFKSSEK